MKRSDVNQRIREATALFQSHGLHLPPWAHWSPAQWEEHPDLAVWCARHQVGWDLTDFGSGDFDRRGLLLFCLRNGIQGDPQSLPYAEKLMVVGEEQETPMHRHRFKVEDIIVRAAGRLVVEFAATDATGAVIDDPVQVRTDGRLRTVCPGESLVLGPGESVTVPRHVYHRFYGACGCGPVVVGEVSQVNDDLEDNEFLEAPERFSPIREDEPPVRLLWHEVAAHAVGNADAAELR